MTKPREPAYRLVKRDGAFEIRAYEPMTLAEIHLNGSRKHAMEEGFQILRGYIAGRNDKGMKLPMTVPVTLQPMGDKSWIIRFIMPSGIQMHKLPYPDDERISLFRVPVGRAAVVRFSGRGDDSKIREQTALLRNWMKDQHIAAAAPPTYAFYNSPLMPPFLRRNEVLIAIEY